jgi:hypothetical protein
MADFAARRALARRDGSRPCTALAHELAGLMDEHRDLWLRRSRPGGLLDSLAHYERVRDDLRAAQS